MKTYTFEDLILSRETDVEWVKLSDAEEAVKAEREKRIETRDMLIDLYNFYAGRLDDFNCVLKKGEADLIYKVAEFIRAKE